MTTITVDGRDVDISNPDKVLFPDSGLTKQELADYFRRIADRMLPFVEDRPVTMHRYPDGIDTGGFYQHKAEDFYPSWVDRVEIRKREGGMIPQVVCNHAATLVYLANLACITPHVWLSRAPHLERPDRLIIDLDPPGDDFGPVRRAARTVHDFLKERLDMEAFVMTTGSSGLHLVVPLRGDREFDDVRAFARELTERVAEENADALTTEIRKAKRRGRVFLDTARNAYGQTAVPPYSPRARPGAPVATPLDWSELGDGDLDARKYTVRNIFRRLGQKDDPWAHMARRRYSLDKAVEKLRAMRPDGQDG